MLAFQYVGPVVYQRYLYNALMSVGSPLDVVDNFNPSADLYYVFYKRRFDKHPTDRTRIVTYPKTNVCLEFRDHFFSNTCSTTCDIISIMLYV
jgi:hypothetical protein